MGVAISFNSVLAVAGSSNSCVVAILLVLLAAVPAPMNDVVVAVAALQY